MSKITYGSTWRSSCRCITTLNRRFCYEHKPEHIVSPQSLHHTA